MASTIILPNRNIGALELIVRTDREDSKTSIRKESTFILSLRRYWEASCGEPLGQANLAIEAAQLAHIIVFSINGFKDTARSST